LLTAWERESGVSDGKLDVDAALLVGSTGITWGWAEGREGIAAPPYMRLEGLFDLVACRLSLRFTGMLARSRLALAADAVHRRQHDPRRALAARARRRGAVHGRAKLQRPVAQRFELTVQPLADGGLAMLGSCAPVRGAISGAVGLEQRPDGPGLRWFVRLNVEPVVAQLRIFDPLLGVQFVHSPCCRRSRSSIGARRDGTPAGHQARRPGLHR
jgi:hypothetical protein